MAMVVSISSPYTSNCMFIPCNSHKYTFLCVHSSLKSHPRHHLCRSAGNKLSSVEAAASSDKEEVFFDGGPHYGDLLTNLVFGLTLIWLPLTVASIFRALFLRYRFTSARVTILSGLTGGNRKDFNYEVIKDVKYVPRFIGEWGDLVITLKDDTQVELKCVPFFRDIANFCLDKSGKAEQASKLLDSDMAKKKGFL